MGFINFVSEQRKHLPITKGPADIGRRTYVVTGANTGLGYECTKHLFAQGAGRVILAVRSIAKGESALAQIRQDTNSSSIGEVWELDMASFASVEAFAKRLATLDRLDGLLENAGRASRDYETTEGLELMLVVNVLATFLLAFRALPTLRETATKFDTKPTLAIVSSGAALAANLKDLFDGVEGNLFETLSTPARMNDDRYPFSKQLEILLVEELASRFPLHETNVIINAVNPGLCHSELARDAKGILWVQITLMKLFLARTTEVGSRTLLHGVLAGAETHGKYLSACAVADVPPWLKGETGAKKTMRVWHDMLAELEIKGHGVDLAALGAKQA